MLEWTEKNTSEQKTYRGASELVRYLLPFYYAITNLTMSALDVLVSGSKLETVLERRNCAGNRLKELNTEFVRANR